MPNQKDFALIGNRIWSSSFDGHRVDVLAPEEVSDNTPVLVMNDGMNVFFSQYASNGQTWMVAEAIASGLIEGSPLVIAVWGEGGEKKFNTRRINEFLCDDHFDTQPSLWDTLDPRLTPATREPRGNYYLQLIAEQILPAVSKEFGVKLVPERTALVGCSVAGVWSIYAATKRPDVFGAVLSFSSHWQFGGSKLVGALATDWITTGHGLLWSDSGTIELDAGSQKLNDEFGALLNASQLEASRFQIRTFAGSGHNETYWSQRLPIPVNWWLESTKSN
jgi:enterochelin esterase-like enzyme